MRVKLKKKRSVNLEILRSLRPRRHDKWFLVLILRRFAIVFYRTKHQVCFTSNWLSKFQALLIAKDSSWLLKRLSMPVHFLLRRPFVAREHPIFPPTLRLLAGAVAITMLRCYCHLSEKPFKQNSKATSARTYHRFTKCSRRLKMGGKEVILLSLSWSDHVAGIDEAGAAQLRRSLGERFWYIELMVVNTRKWIGTTEIYTMLTFAKFRYLTLELYRPNDKMPGPWFRLS